MDPRELAGMLAREIDTGMAIALRSIDAAGVIAVERVIARIGAAPEADDIAWNEVTWQSEVVMHIDPERRTAVLEDPEHSSLTLLEAVSALPAQALLGVGPIRDRFLASLGIHTVGQIASLHSAAVARWIAAEGSYALEIVGRARALPAQWPADIARVVGSRSVLAVALAGPDRLDGGDQARSAIAWEACMRLSGCLDQSVLARLPARGLGTT